MKPILEIRNISKKYRIGTPENYLSLREKLLGAFRFEKNKQQDFWALNDVSFTVQPGESIGIIGRNGAGKSTLLKVLSKITPPTAGKIISRGRVASLLEVGTGFHPELTGRENVFFNGSLLGMKRKEIERNFDSIVDFSGVEKFLDTPLKHYSSGMQLRLAFAVAAFLEPEILIIDEVLAVGDAEFQKKCMGKMEDVSRSGRTILFVSHNMAAIQNLCKRVVLLSGGKVLQDGSVGEAIQHYHQSSRLSGDIKAATHKPTYVSALAVDSGNGNVYTHQPTRFAVEVTSFEPRENVYIGLGINDVTGSRLFTLFSKFLGKKFNVKTGVNQFTAHLQNLPLKPGVYSIEVYVGDGATVFDYYNQGFNFEVFAPETLSYALIPDETQGAFVISQEWSNGTL